MSKVNTLSLESNRQIGIEQNRCAMACQGCGAAILFNSDLPICTQRFLRMVSSVFCPELRRQSQPQQFLSTGCLFR